MTDSSGAHIDPYDAAVAARLKEVRRQHGLNQTQVAAGLGVSYQQFQKYERGVNRISAGSLHRLAEFLEVPVSAFFGDQRQATESLIDPAEAELLKGFRELPYRELQIWCVQVVGSLALTLHNSPKPPPPP